MKTCFPNWQWDGIEVTDDVDSPKPGTRKMVRKHKKEVRILTTSTKRIIVLDQLACLVGSIRVLANTRGDMNNV